MDQDVIIDFNHVSKKFPKSLNHLMKYGIVDIVKNTLGLDTHSEKLRKNEFWAVNGVSFKLKRGETLGIIGANGSGKSTILKMINGILTPDKGEIKIKGEVGALIEVGAGFHPMLTGRENIYVNGAILGMSKREIDQKFKDIVEFADIGDFLDAPVKTYSSGMYVRLGFSVAINCSPQILLIDEILSVGDLYFQNKCLKYLAEYRKKTDGIVFVGHNLEHIRNLCDKVLVINKGKVVFLGNAEVAIVKYYELFHNKSAQTIEKKVDDSYIRKTNSDEISFIEGGILDSNNLKINEVSFGKPINIFLKFKCNRKLEKLHFSAAITNSNGIMCVWKMSNDVGESIIGEENFSKGKYFLKIKFESINLNAGIYSPSFAIYNSETNETYGKIYLRPFRINGEFITRNAILHPTSDWEVMRIE